MRSLPKILSISTVPFTNLTGSGALMSTMFGGWDNRRLACIYSADFALDPTICTEGGIVRCCRFPINRFQGFDFKLFNFNIADFSWEAIKRQLLLKKQFKDAVKTIDDMIMKFKPECIYHYILGSDYFMSMLAKEISRRHSLPLVIHMMDDWPGVQEFELANKGDRDAFSKVRYHWMDLFNSASVCLGISERMCREYQARFDMNFTPVSNAIDTGVWELGADRSGLHGSKRVIVYAGSITEKEIESLYLFKDTFLEMVAQGWDIEWHLYTGNSSSDYIGSLNVNERIIFKDAVAGDAYRQSLIRADILLLALSFDVRTMRYLSLSMQNKMPEYMATGNPVLAIGPKGLATIDYAIEDKWAHVITDKDARLVKEALSRLLSDESYCRELGKRAREVVIKNHDLAVMRERLLGGLVTAIDSDN